jgi:hypothetical protein
MREGALHTIGGGLHKGRKILFVRKILLSTMGRSQTPREEDFVHEQKTFAFRGKIVS